MNKLIITKPKIVLEKGKPTEIILRWKDFQELLEKIEDFYDLTEIKKAKEKKPQFRDFNAFLAKYGL